MSQTEKYSELFNFMNEAVKVFEEKETEFKKCAMEQFDAQWPAVFSSLRTEVAKQYSAGCWMCIVSPLGFSVNACGRDLTSKEVDRFSKEWWKEYSFNRTRFISIQDGKLVWNGIDAPRLRFGRMELPEDSLLEWDSAILHAAKQQMVNDYSKTFDYVEEAAIKKVKEQVSEMLTEMREENSCNFTVNCSYQPKVLLEAVGKSMANNWAESRFFSNISVKVVEEWLLEFDMKITLR